MHMLGLWSNVYCRMLVWQLSHIQLLYVGQFTANQVVFATSPLRLTTSNLISQLNTYGYVTSSLTRGWVCRLQLLQVLASAFILRSFFAGLMTTFYCLRFETPQTEGPGPRICILRGRLSLLTEMSSRNIFGATLTNYLVLVI
jgi:hypothetical protein